MYIYNFAMTATGVDPRIFAMRGANGNIYLITLTRFLGKLHLLVVLSLYPFVLSLFSLKESGYFKIQKTRRFERGGRGQGRGVQTPKTLP